MPLKFHPLHVFSRSSVLPLSLITTELEYSFYNCALHVGTGLPHEDRTMFRHVMQNVPTFNYSQ